MDESGIVDVYEALKERAALARTKRAEKKRNAFGLAAFAVVSHTLSKYLVNVDVSDASSHDVDEKNIGSGYEDLRRDILPQMAVVVAPRLRRKRGNATFADYLAAGASYTRALESVIRAGFASDRDSADTFLKPIEREALNILRGMRPALDALAAALDNESGDVDGFRLNEIIHATVGDHCWCVNNLWRDLRGEQTLLKVAGAAV